MATPIVVPDGPASGFSARLKAYGASLPALNKEELARHKAQAPSCGDDWARVHTPDLLDLPSLSSALNPQGSALTRVASAPALCNKPISSDAPAVPTPVAAAAAAAAAPIFSSAFPGAHQRVLDDDHDIGEVDPLPEEELLSPAEQSFVGEFLSPVPTPGTLWNSFAAVSPFTQGEGLASLDELAAALSGDLTNDPATTCTTSSQNMQDDLIDGLVV